MALKCIRASTTNAAKTGISQVDIVARICLWLVAVCLATLLLFSAAYLVCGSLEQIPTQEQQDKVHIGATVGIILFATLETIVVISLVRLRRRTGCN